MCPEPAVPRYPLSPAPVLPSALGALSGALAPLPLPRSQDDPGRAPSETGLQWSANAPGRIRFSMVLDFFFNGLPNGSGGFSEFFFNGLPNGPGWIRFSMVRPTGRI